jgi:hypothetical protein
MLRTACSRRSYYDSDSRSIALKVAMPIHLMLRTMLVLKHPAVEVDP